jgi:type VI secretion system protein ImpC
MLANGLISSAGSRDAIESGRFAFHRIPATTSEVVMTKPKSFEKSEVRLAASFEDAPATIEPETPFRIAILGDWSRQSRTEADISRIGPILVDRDNFDEVMRHFGVEITLQLTGDPSSRITVQFSEIDDFHPDSIYRRVGTFASLRDLRQRLRNRSTVAQAAAEVRRWSSPVEAQTADNRVDSESRPVQNDSRIAGGADLLEQMLSGTQIEQSAHSMAKSMAEPGWDEFLQALVKPYIIPGDDPEHAELVASVDRATSELMRSILHDPKFQEVEASWRALHFLVKGIDTGPELKLYLVDISKTELEADLSSEEELRASGLYKLLVDQSIGQVGAEPWALLCGNYTFDSTREDLNTLAQISHVAKAAGAPFIAAADPRIIGCNSAVDLPALEELAGVDGEKQDAWAALRGLPAASYIGLAMPRFLLRLPYGESTDSTEEFEFEEFGETTDHENYLWGNPAFACAFLLARSFSDYGWNLRPGAILDIEGLPLHVYEEEGESKIKPCAEALLTLSTAEAIIEQGIMPLLSYSGSDAVRLARFQSVAQPPTGLNGKWTS